jgi:cystathionine beta-lyase/cystathionine gamma-synthase
MKSRSIATQLICEGETQHRVGNAVTLPIFQTSTYLYPDLFNGKVNYDDFKYIRLNNTPNHEALHQKLAAIEGTESALVTASGMAAISATLLTLLKSGDHLLAQDCLYGGTLTFISEELKALDITVDFFKANEVGSLSAKVRPNTKAIYIESITNPLLQVIDVPQVVAFAKKHGLTSIIDNTFPSPVNYRPAEMGIDLVVHSATKYLNGHSDIVAGVVAGSKKWVDTIKHKLNHWGGSLDPHACFLLQRSLKTLHLRIDGHNRNALKIAQFLGSHPQVAKVHYPGLPSHPSYAYVQEHFAGASGMIALEHTQGFEGAKRLVQNVKVFLHAPSLGGVESLVTIPWLTTHVGMSESERARIGLSPGFVRLSVGLEDSADLIADLSQALG